LPKLVYTLTKITKKKSINEKYKFPDKTRTWGKEEVELGINCNGLGFVDWGCQLNPLTNNYSIKEGYGIDDDNLKVLLWIFNDENLCLDIADNILKKHRKDFLKLASFFRKQKINPSEINRKIGVGEINISFNHSFYLDEIKGKKVSLGYYSKHFLEGERGVGLLEECKLHELLFLQDFISHKEEFITKIEEKITHFKEAEKKQNKLNDFVRELIIPYEALDNL